METILLPFSPRFIILTICAVVTALLIGIAIFDHNPKAWEFLLIPIVIFGALTLMIARQLVSELEMLAPDIEYFVVPPLCPLVGSPYDFSRTADHIDRAILSTDAWLAQHGLQQGKIPHEMRLHSH